MDLLLGVIRFDAVCRVNVSETDFDVLITQKSVRVQVSAHFNFQFMKFDAELFGKHSSGDGFTAA